MKALLYTILICVFLPLHAQGINAIPKLQFTYDNSGNQIERKLESLVIAPIQSEEESSLSQLYQEMIRVYPNPTRGKFYIEWEKEISQYISQIEVLSADALVRKNSINSSINKLDIDLTSEQSGIYFVRFTFMDGSIVSKKVIKL